MQTLTTPSSVAGKLRSDKVLIWPLIVSLVAIMALLSYQVWSSYHEVLTEARIKTRNYAAIFETRLDASLRHIDAVLQTVARTVPNAALSKQAVPLYANQIDSDLNFHLTNFNEMASVRIFDVDGDLLYSSNWAGTKAANIADRPHFRLLRDNPKAGLVFSDVLVARTTGIRTMFLVRALTDAHGGFLGVVVAAIDFAYLEGLFRSLDLGAHGSIAIYRSDQFTRVLRWPESKEASDAPLPQASPTRATLVPGVKTATISLVSARDGVERIYSYHVLSGSPFFVSVGLALDDVLTPWRLHALGLSTATILLIGLLCLLFFALMRATIQARMASSAKSSFLANMSHEIRTPLNAILGMLALLRKTELTGRQADYAAKTEGAARSLLGLLNEILDFSKIEAGRMTLAPHPFRLDQLMRDLAVILSANVGARNAEVLFDVDPAVPRQLVGDAMRLQQVLINLGGNAIKFTPQGEVVLSVKLVQRGEATVTLEFSVRDTGIGIAPENQARIFSVFTQAESSTSRRFGGTGLGVSISSRLVAMMGGTLQLESALGQGSRFYFSITMPVLAEVDAEAPSATMISPPPRVLVVDDNPTTRDVIARMGQSLGWSIELADSGKRALEILQTRTAAGINYQVIFVDWQMPELDGWETCRRIRELSLIGEPPVIVMVTAHGQDMLAQRTASDQRLLDAFLVKPVTASMLFDAFVDARSDHGQARRSRSVAPSGQKRLSGMRLLVAEDNPNNQQVAGELLEAEGASVHIASNGQQAIDAVAAADPPFDVVLMDLQMPVMDGYTATSHIRNDLGMQTLPIVAMTANAMDSDRAACLAAGMNDHVGKPFDLNNLVNVLCKHAGRGEVASATGTALPALPEAITEVAAAAEVDVGAALRRLGGKLDVYQRMLRNFVLELGTILTQLSTCTLASQVELAVRLLHTLKGLAGTLGATKLALKAAHGETLLAARPTTAAMVQIIEDACAEFTAARPGLESLLRALQAAERPDAGVVAAPDSHAVRETLRTIAGQLENADMAATDTMAALRRQFGGVLNHELQAMDDAIGMLDFERALQLCNELLNEQPA
ncbi:MAG: response regulator [Burkholderiales bacterium]